VHEVFQILEVLLLLFELGLPSCATVIYNALFLQTEWTVQCDLLVAFVLLHFFLPAM